MKALLIINLIVVILLLIIVIFTIYKTYTIIIKLQSSEDKIKNIFVKLKEIIQFKDTIKEYYDDFEAVKGQLDTIIKIFNSMGIKLNNVYNITKNTNDRIKQNLAKNSFNNKRMIKSSSQTNNDKNKPKTAQNKDNSGNISNKK